MGSQGTTPATDEFATVTKNDTVVIMHTTTEPYQLDSKFTFSEENCLIYAENVTITGTLDLRGKKSFGLFCSNITVKGATTIDISGFPGEDQPPTIDGTGRDGTDGKPSGQVWTFVQHIDKDSVSNLTILAHGGRGGKGGDTAERGKTGGAGGSGGNSGHVEILYGSTPMEVVLALPTLRCQLWHARALDFLNGYSCSALPRYVTNQDKSVLTEYTHLHDALHNLEGSLENPILTGSVVDRTKQVLREILGSTNAPKDAPTSATSELKAAWEQIKSITTTYRNPNVDSALNGISSLLQSLKPDKQSALANVLATVYHVVDGDRTSLLGPGGIGGASGIGGDPPGTRGETGKDSGGIQVVNLHLDGDVDDLNATQAFAFPDQCQMLLNKANQHFFTNTTDSRKTASGIYAILMARLGFLETLEDHKTSALFKSYDKMENILKVTLSGLTQLNSVYSEAKSRFNRLLIGQDMFGHLVEWVPRLSFQYYQKSITNQLSFLEKQEKSTAGYEAALKNGTELSGYIADSIKQLGSNKQAADDHVSLLTGTNGPLSTNAYKIDNFTPEMKSKRDDIKKRLSEIEFKYQWDPKLILDGLGALITSPFNLTGLNNLLQYGYKVYESTTNVPGLSGKVNKDYIIRQLSTCSDTLDSLAVALKTNRDKTIQLDDAGALKVLATADSIRKILDEFQKAIPEEQQKGIRKALDDYTETVLTRNNAVIDYNSNIQLLLDALQTQKYCVEQTSKLGGASVKIDPTLPSVVFWLRKMRDSLRLQLMGYMNYESRAIRFWGLLDDIPMSSPGPLMDHIALGNTQSQLKSFFDTALEYYRRSMRVIWPADPHALGLLYKLSIDPDKTGDIFRDWVDIRLQEMRIWLFGAELRQADAAGRKLLFIQVTHGGDETIIDTRSRSLRFAHDPLHVQFVYETAKVSGIHDVPGQSVFTIADLEHDFGIGGIPQETSCAPLGPFATLRLRITQKANPGIRMDNLREGYIEFRGSNRSAERLAFVCVEIYSLLLVDHENQSASSQRLAFNTVITNAHDDRTTVKPGPYFHIFRSSGDTYSPDFDPIEEIFAELKGCTKKAWPAFVENIALLIPLCQYTAEASGNNRKLPESSSDNYRTESA
ncbi:hypothetical protein BDW59DRAFT_166897 [Aspergillus cavernicola]|uniref:Non-repetitive/WGA-negative nucleoporin C-terminal-domain-containing protein n=1 Tax=Aspergillus cavernicola TaxID=176166 RepID=A0ABR4HIB4_9EURO